MENEVPYQFITTMLIIAIIVFFIVKFMNNTPSYDRFDEGFYGGVARGAGHPDCLRTLPEGSQLLDIVASANKVPAGVSDASADYKEMELILSKLACLKKDLLSPSGIVEATRTQAFETAHDRMNTGEVCAMCLNQSITARDLDIIFATWRDRGRVLLRKLCTEANLSEVQTVEVETLFKKAWEDVYDVATSRCLKTDFSKQNGGSTDGGNVGGVEPPSLKDMGTYDYKYGGVSASGWNGAV
jgi:hypothetical protein